MSLNTTINGVRLYISAVPVATGPDGIPAQFQSNIGTGPSSPILIELAQPVQSFAIEIVGASFNGNHVVALDENGIEISRVTVRDDVDSYGVIPAEVFAPIGRPISQINLIPAVGDYVAYRNISLGLVQPITAVETPIINVDPTPIVPTPAPTPIQPRESPIAGLWYEERFVGSPASYIPPDYRVDEAKLSMLLASTPLSTRNIPSIQYIDDTQTLASPMTVRWSRTDYFEDGTLSLNGASDDGMRITVDGVVIVDMMKEQSRTPFLVTVPIRVGMRSIEVLYFNDRSLGTAIVNTVFTRSSGEVVIVPPVVPSPKPLPPAELPPIVQEIPTVRLNDIIRFSETTINRSYQKDSMNQMPSHVIVAANISDTYDVYLELSSAQGVALSPTSFLLPKATNTNIEVRFDTAIVNTYPEGTSRLTLPIRLTSKAQIVTSQYAPLPIPVPVVPVPPDPITPIGIVPPPLPPITATEPIVPPVVRIPDTLLPTDPAPTPEPPAEYTPTWISGYGGQLQTGYPPVDWVQDPYTGFWYQQDDPYTLNDYGRMIKMPTIDSSINVNQIQPPRENSAGGSGGGNYTQKLDASPFNGSSGNGSNSTNGGLFDTSTLLS